MLNFLNFLVKNLPNIKGATIDSEKCGEVQVQDDLPEFPQDNSIPIEQGPYQDFVEAIQVAPLEM